MSERLPGGALASSGSRLRPDTAQGLALLRNTGMLDLAVAVGQHVAAGLLLARAAAGGSLLPLSSAGPSGWRLGKLR